MAAAVAQEGWRREPKKGGDDNPIRAAVAV